MKASILFITYNHSRFVAEAIRSAMAQDYADLELVVCDDASSDDTRALLEEELRNCPAHIAVIRAHSEQNAGLITNFNRGIAACSGEVVVVMAGDDVSQPNRVSAIMDEFSAHPDCMLVFSNWQRINAGGRVLGGAAKHCEKRVFKYDEVVTDVYAGSAVYGAAAAYRSKVARSFGPMAKGHHPEDRCYWVRALLMGEIRYLDEPLVLWRTHETNINHFLKGGDVDGNRRKMVRGMLHKQHYPIQLRRDIRHARVSGLVSHELADRLLGIIDLDRECRRLRRYSMTVAPWRLWCGAARRVIRMDPSLKTFRSNVLFELRTRLSSRRRARRWSRMMS